MLIIAAVSVAADIILILAQSTCPSEPNTLNLTSAERGNPSEEDAAKGREYEQRQ